jgi:dTDP-4-dehydrorhamnose 3,5-epimerase
MDQEKKTLHSRRPPLCARMTPFNAYCWRKTMKVVTTDLPGVLIIEPKVFGDERGFFYESFNAKAFNEATGLETNFVQDNHSRSQKCVLRGLHYQLENTQGKLVRVTVGEVLDVAVDIRRGSPTFGKWVSETLTPDNGKQLWVPPGFAHGFCTLEPDTVIAYKVTGSYYSAECDKGLSWDDSAIGIVWPDLADRATLSPKDQRQPVLADLPEYFAWQG